MEEINGGRPAPKLQKPNLLRRLLAFLLTAALVVGAVALVAWRDRINLDSIRRWFSYRSLERSDSGQAETFSYGGSASDTFANLDGDLLVCSPTGFQLYSGSGALYVDETVLLEHPVVSACGKRGLVYDAGGQELFVLSGREVAFTLSQETERSLISASLNPNGWLVLVSQEHGYKGSVTVYDGSYAPVMRLDLSSRFVMDAALSPDNKTVAVLTVGLEEGSFDCRVDLYRLDHDAGSAAPDASCSVGNNAPLALRWTDDGIWLLGENGVYRVDGSGALGGGYTYSGRYLKGFSLEGDGFAALLLGKYRAGSNAVLTIVDGAGAVQASLSIDEQVLSLSAAGRYVAVLTADRLDLYDQQLGLYATLDGTQGARRVLIRSDGTAMLIGSGEARLYVP